MILGTTPGGGRRALSFLPKRGTRSIGPICPISPIGGCSESFLQVAGGEWIRARKPPFWILPSACAVFRQRNAWPFFAPLRLCVSISPSGRVSHAKPRRRKVVQKVLQLLGLPFRHETVFFTFYSVASKPFRNTLHWGDRLPTSSRQGIIPALSSSFAPKPDSAAERNFQLKCQKTGYTRRL